MEVILPLSKRFGLVIYISHKGHGHVILRSSIMMSVIQMGPVELIPTIKFQIL